MYTPEVMSYMTRMQNKSPHTDTITVSETHSQTPTFNESTHITDELSDSGWREVYYADDTVEVDGESHTVMKAVYEHVDIGVKATVRPATTFTSNVPVKHVVSFIDPLQTLDELYAFDRVHRALEHVLLPTLPTIPGEAPFADIDTPDNPFTVETGGSQHTLPDQYFTGLADSITIERVAEHAYNWTHFSDDIVSRLETHGMVNIEYAVNNWVYLRRLNDIRSEYPELVPDEIETKLRVVTIGEEKHVSFDCIGTGGEFITDYESHVNESAVDIDSFDDGRVMATATLSFDDRASYKLIPDTPQRDVRFKMFTIETISFTDAGAELKPRTVSEKVLSHFR